MPISGGIDWDLVMSRIARWVIAGSGLSSSHVLWSQNKAPRPSADGIVMRLMGIQVVGDSWSDVVENPLTFSDLTVTAVDDVANTVTVVGHGMSTGDGPVRVDSTGVLPGGLVVDTDYWLIRVDDDTLKFAATFAATGGADIDGLPSGNPVTPVDLIDAGSGTITVSDTDKTVRAGQEILQVARATTKVTLNLECHTEDSTGLDMAVAVLHRVSARASLPSQVALLDEAGAGVVEIGPVHAVRGHLDALLFEPRAVMDIQLSVVSEDSEFGTVIESADLTPTYNDEVLDTERVPIGPR